MSEQQTGSFYWCLDHKRVEGAGEACPPDRCMGPYKSRDEAAHWKDKVDARNEKWDQEDRAWEDEG